MRILMTSRPRHRAVSPVEIVTLQIARWTRRLPPTRRIRGATVFALWAYCYGMHRLRGQVSSHRLIATGVFDFNMKLAPSDFVDLHLLFVPHFYEPDELAFVRRKLCAGDTFVDVGAHAGLYSLVAWRAVGGEGRVLAIEAHPDTFDRLAANLKMNQASNARALNVGVSDKEETLRLDSGTGPFAAASSFLPGVLEATAGAARAATRTSRDIACRPLLSLLDEQGITRIHGMKIDVEGFEYRVLSAFFRDAAPSRWPDFVVLEFHEEWVGAVGGNVATLLEELGYARTGKAGLNLMMERLPVPAMHRAARDAAASAQRPVS